jgi:hypothetical protein
MFIEPSAISRERPTPQKVGGKGVMNCYIAGPRNQPFMSRVSGKPYNVYVLWSPRARRFYIGLSENPQRRLAQHNQSGGGWTNRHAPWQLV